MMIKTPEKLRKTWGEEVVHLIPLAAQQGRKRPKRVLLFMKIHEHQRDDVSHALAVANFLVKHGVGG